MPAKLTEAAIAAAVLSAAPGQIELRDSGGLVLRISKRPDGAPSGNWSIRRTHQGRLRRLALGPWPGLKLAAAREVLSVALGRLAKGEDIFAAAEAAHAQAQGWTVAEAIEAYGLAKRSDLKGIDERLSALRRFLRPVQAERVAMVTQPRIAKLADAVRGSAPASARAGTAYTRALWSWLFERGEVAQPLTLKAGQSKRRERVLSLEEMRAIWSFAEAEPYPFGAIVKALLLTALRKSEISKLRVAEVNFAARKLALPASRMKAKQSFDAALSEAAMVVIQHALDAHPAGSPYVFATVPEVPFSGWSRAKRRADKAVGFSDWTIHDFRRSIVTCLAERGLADVGVLDSMLAHAATASLGSGAAAVYQRAGLLEPRRKAAEIWGRLLLGVGEFAEEVPLPMVAAE